MSPAEPTRVRPAPSPQQPAPARRRGGAGRWSLTVLALATACGFLLGVLVVVTLGGGGTTTVTQTRRVTVPAQPPATGGTVVVKTLVPAMVGQPLDVAKARAGRAKFSVTVDAGGGVFGVLRERNWDVVAQRPAAGELLEQGSTVHVDIVKR